MVLTDSPQTQPSPVTEYRNKGGRPSKFKKRYLRIARELLADGKSMDALSQRLGVSNFTVYHWQRNNSEFSQAIEQGRECANGLVEKALFERAVGWVGSETEDKLVNGSVVTLTIEKQYAPDPVSIIFWLSNRAPDRWKRDATNQINIQTVAGVPQETLEQLKKLARLTADLPEPAQLPAPIDVTPTTPTT